MKCTTQALCLIAAALVLAAGWVSSVWAQESKDPIATVIMVKGTVTWREGPEAPWQPAVPGQYLFHGQEVRTHPLSRAMIAFAATQSVVRINENSHLEVQSTAGRAQRKKDRVSMLIGEVYSKVRKDREFEVETPSSVASVRGTEFDVSYLQGWTQLLVADGVVELLSKLQQVMVEAALHTRTVVDEQGNVTPPEAISPDEVDDAVGWAEEIEPRWRLKLNAEEGPGETFAIHLRAIDRTTNLLDPSCNIVLSALTCDMPEVLLSTDEGATWNAQPIVRLSDGAAKVLAKSLRTGKASVCAVGPDCKPGVLDLGFVVAAETIKVIVEFEDEAGNKKQYEIQVRPKGE